MRFESLDWAEPSEALLLEKTPSNFSLCHEMKPGCSVNPARRIRVLYVGSWQCNSGTVNSLLNDKRNFPPEVANFSLFFHF